MISWVSRFVGKQLSTVKRFFTSQYGGDSPPPENLFDIGMIFFSYRNVNQSDRMAMKTLLPARLLLAALVLTGATRADDSSTALPGPQNLGLHLALLRFEPASRTNLVRPFKKMIEGHVQAEVLREKGLTHVIEVISNFGTVDVLHRADRDVVIAPDSKVRFDATEERPVVVVGVKDVMPPSTKFGLSLEVTARPIDPHRFSLSWNGSLKWSPELIDRWKFNPQKFLSFASSAALTANNLLAKEEKDPLQIGLSVAQLFRADTPAAGQIYELPVVKEIAFQSSRVCWDNELILNSTVSEVGGRPAQAIVLVLWPNLNP